MKNIMKKILIINGPNLNLLGNRENKIYGNLTLAQIEKECIKKANSYQIPLLCFQSNSESAIIDKIHQIEELQITDIIVNLGAYSHTSIAILDALKATNCNIFEVHLSNIFAREEFRHKSYVSNIAKVVITGAKHFGYLMLIDLIAQSN